MWRRSHHPGAGLLCARLLSGPLLKWVAILVFVVVFGGAVLSAVTREIGIPSGPTRSASALTATITPITIGDP